MERTGPSKGWYAVAGAAVVIATAAAIAIFAAGIVDTVSGFHSIPRGQEVVIDLDEGDYTLYWEQRFGQDAGVPAGFVIRDPAGVPVPTAPYESEEVLSRGEVESVAVATFYAPVDGPYTFFSPMADLAVSKGVFERIGKSFLLALAIGGAGLLVGLGIFLFVLLRRRSARLATAPATQHYGGPPAGTWQQPTPTATAPATPASSAWSAPAATSATPATGQPPPPAGWYPDPEADGLRYWDGAQWTEHRAVRGG